jgi:hypothetical protein
MLLLISMVLYSWIFFYQFHHSLIGENFILQIFDCINDIYYAYGNFKLLAKIHLIKINTITVAGFVQI